MDIRLTSRTFFGCIGVDNFVMLFRDETTKYPFLREWINENSLNTTIILDSRGEYRTFCEAMKGQYVTIDEQTPCGLDPVHLGALERKSESEIGAYALIVVQLLLTSIQASIEKEALIEPLTTQLKSYLLSQTDSNFANWIETLPLSLKEKIQGDPGLNQWLAWAKPAPLFGRRNQDNTLRVLDLSQLKDPALWFSLFVLKAHAGFPFEEEDNSNLVFLDSPDDWVEQNEKAQSYLKAIEGCDDLEFFETTYGYIESLHQEGKGAFSALFRSATCYELKTSQYTATGERYGIFTQNDLGENPLNFVIIKNLKPIAEQVPNKHVDSMTSKSERQNDSGYDDEYETWIQKKLENDETQGQDSEEDDWPHKTFRRTEQKIPLMWCGFIVVTFLIATFALGIATWLPGAIRTSPVKVVDLVQLSLDAAKIYPTEAEEDEALGVVFDRLKSLQAEGYLILNAQQVMAAPETMVLKSEALLPERETLKAFEADENRQGEDAS